MGPKGWIEDHHRPAGYDMNNDSGCRSRNIHQADISTQRYPTVFQPNRAWKTKRAPVSRCSNAWSFYMGPKRRIEDHHRPAGYDMNNRSGCRSRNITTRQTSALNAIQSCPVYRGGGGVTIVPVCASPIYRHYSGHRYYSE